MAMQTGLAAIFGWATRVEGLIVKNFGYLFTLSRMRRVAFKHNLAVWACAAPLAALIKEASNIRGARAGVIPCGGNTDMPVLAQVLSGRTPIAT